MKKVKLGNLWKESKIVSDNPNPEKRIKVKLNVRGVEKRSVNEDKGKGTKYFIRKAGQFIYGKQNLHKGAFGVIPKELDGFESSSDIPAFDVVKGCSPEWIYYYFKQGDFYKELEQYSKGTGSKRIHPDKISHLEIPLPDLQTQKQILKKIKSMEKEISQLSQNVSYDNSLLTKLKQSVLQEAVQGKLVPQNKEDEPATELLKQIKKEKEKLIKEKKIKKGKELPPIEEDEIPYELPKGWVWCRLGDVCELITQGPNPKYDGLEDERFAVLKTKDFYDTIINYEKTDKISNELFNKWKRFKLYSGDLIFGLVGVGSTGKCNIFKEQENKEFILTRATGLIRLLDKKLILPEFTKIVLNSPFGKEIGESFIEGSTGQIVIKTSQLKTFPYPLPSTKEQKRIVEKVDDLMKLCDELELRIKENKRNSNNLMGAVLREVFESN